MSSRPGAFALSKEATHFVFSNVPLFFHHIKVLAPLMVLSGVIKQAGRIAHAEWVAYVMAVVTLVLYACFALAWHRSSLQEPDKAHERNPANLRAGDWGFVAIFVTVTGLFGIGMQGLNHLAYKMDGYEDAIALTGLLAILLVMGIFIYVFIRASFLFPARSVGVRLGLADVRRASKGMAWPVLGANIIFTLLFLVAFSVYSFVAGFIGTVAAGNAKLEQTQAITISTILSVPIIIAVFFFVALCVSALSKAYQWGIQNNDIVPDVPLKRPD